jgi:hypothetical protein
MRQGGRVGAGWTGSGWPGAAGEKLGGAERAASADRV